MIVDLIILVEMDCFIFTEPEPVFNVDVDTSGVVGGVGGPYVYASFPVDVVVYFHMQPSTIRYTCSSMLR